jgi:hypothetical protein
MEILLEGVVSAKIPHFARRRVGGRTGWRCASIAANPDFE